jgi:hypothetical protein
MATDANGPAVAVVVDLGSPLHLFLCTDDIQRWQAMGMRVETISGGTTVSTPADEAVGESALPSTEARPSAGVETAAMPMYGASRSGTG